MERSHHLNSAVAYLGTNAPRRWTFRFSYTRSPADLGSALHRVPCGAKNPEKKHVPLSLLGDYRPITNQEFTAGRMAANSPGLRDKHARESAGLSANRTSI